MARRSAPPSSRWVANEWRSACGDTPPATAACRAQTRSRRRTSEVDSRRPDFERNSAGSSRRAGARGEHGAGPLEVVGHRPQRDLPDGDDPRLGRPCPPRAAPRRRSRRRRRRARRAPRPAGPRRRRPRRCARSRTSSGVDGPDAVQQRGHLVGAQHARQRGRALGRGHQLGRVVGDVAVLAQRPVERAQGGELAGDRRRHVAAVRQQRGVAAQRPRRDLLGLDGLRRAPQRELREVQRVGAPRLGGHPAAAQVGVEQRQRLAPGGTSAAAYPRAPWPCSSSTPTPVRSPPSASSRGRDRRRTDGSRRRARGCASRARATRRPCGTRSCASVSGACTSARSFFATRTTTPPCWTRGWEEVGRIEEIGRPCPAEAHGPAASDRSGDVDRRADRHAVVELLDVRDVHPDAAVGGGRADRGVVGRAVDAHAVVDAQPAGLDRVLRRAARDDLAGQLARPVAVGDVPGGVDRLVLDRCRGPPGCPGPPCRPRSGRSWPAPGPCRAARRKLLRWTMSTVPYLRSRSSVATLGCSLRVRDREAPRSRRARRSPRRICSCSSLARTARPRPARARCARRRP